MLLKNYRQRDFPSFYPLFTKTEKGALKIIGARLQFGDRENGIEVVLSNDLQSKQPIEAALLTMACSFQGLRNHVCGKSEEDVVRRMRT